MELLMLSALNIGNLIIVFYNKQKQNQDDTKNILLLFVGTHLQNLQAKFRFAEKDSLLSPALFSIAPLHRYV
jgi:uncharacterized membrane protein YbjE (DUF340 family)